MENIGSVQKLLKEYEEAQIDLLVQNKVANLLEQSKEYEKDLDEEEKRSKIDLVIAENFEIRGYIEHILDYLENNESKLAYDMVYTDLNREVRAVILFISDNITKFNN